MPDRNDASETKKDTNVSGLKCRFAESAAHNTGFIPELVMPPRAGRADMPLPEAVDECPLTLDAPTEGGKRGNGFAAKAGHLTRATKAVLADAAFCVASGGADNLDWGEVQ